MFLTSIIMWWPLKGPFIFSTWPIVTSSIRLLRARVFGYGLGAFADSVFGQFTGQQKPYGGLDLPAGDCGPLVVVGEPGSLGRDALEYIVNEAVHDAHRLRGDAGVRMDLLQHFVDVHRVAFLPLAFLFLVSLGDVLLRLAGLLGRFTAGLRWHDALNLVERRYGRTYL